MSCLSNPRTDYKRKKFREKGIDKMIDKEKINIVHQQKSEFTLNELNQKFLLYKKLIDI